MKIKKSHQAYTDSFEKMFMTLVEKHSIFRNTLKNIFLDLNTLYKYFFPGFPIFSHDEFLITYN